MRLKISKDRVQGDFVKKVEELSGQDVLSCYQCGKCSAGCPVASDMDVSPNQVIRLVQIGDEGVLESEAIWMCASCFTCAARCPKGVDLAKIMEALRIIILRKGGDAIKITEIPKEVLETAPQQAIVSGLRKYTD